MKTEKWMMDAIKEFELEHPKEAMRLQTVHKSGLEELKRYFMSVATYCYLIAEGHNKPQDEKTQPKAKPKAVKPKKKSAVAWEMPKHVNRWN